MNLLDAPGHLGDLAGLLGVSLAQWSYRETAADPAAARRAANTAIAAIDDMLRLLYDARRQLITEIRIADDAALAAADELLSRCDRERPGSPG